MKAITINVFWSILLLVFFLVPSTTRLEGADIQKAQVDNQTNVAAIKLAKAMLDREADLTALELIGGTFDPRDSKIIGIKEIHNFIKEEGIIIRMLPERVQMALNDKNTIGLMVSKFNRRPGVLYRMSDQQRAVYLTWLLEDEWMENFWVQGVGTGGGAGDSSPCNGEYLKNCTGCQGWENGRYNRCLCTNSCKVERPCLPCLAEIPVNR